MYKFSKKRVIFHMALIFFFGWDLPAQEPEEKPPESSIFCIDIEVEIIDFKNTNNTTIRVCCGGIFEEGQAPCKIISKASYESFTRQSEEVFVGVDQEISIEQLLEPTTKRSKTRNITVVNSATSLLPNNLKIAIKKGVYSVNSEGKIGFEIEYIK
jgi:hypothetical protein